MSAFRDIVEQNKKLVYHLAVDMMGKPDDADDISQEVFIRAYRSVGSFRGEAKISSWLYRITVNVCLDYRSRKHSKMTELQEDMESATRENNNASHADHPATATESRMIRDHIDAALELLTPRERTIFVLRHYHELSMKEIASTLRVTVGTVKSTLFRAVEKLQKELSFYRQDLGMEEE